MSAIYHADHLNALVKDHQSAILDWIIKNPGQSVEACASALSVAYEVVFAVATQQGMAILPSASGELHWHAGH